MSDTSNETDDLPLRPRGDGRFAKAPRRPGNPSRKVAAFRAALMRSRHEQDIKTSPVKLRDDAKAGDKAAVKLLSSTSSANRQPAAIRIPSTAKMRAFRRNACRRSARRDRACWPLGWLLKIGRSRRRP